MRQALVVFAALTVPAVAWAEKPCVSGPKEGQRPGPYSFVMCTGEQRGKSHCYICDTADRPAVIVFARAMTGPLAKLAAGLDKALADHKKAELRGWVTLLHEDQSAIDGDVLKWVKKHGLKSVPVGVFEDTDGPPSYKLSRDAEVTVLLYVKQKVVVNRAFRAKELTNEKVAEVLKQLTKIVKNK
jgi:hypothetical protein